MTKDNPYTEQPVLLGDLRGGLCGSGLCKQLRSVAADEIERLTRERDEAAALGRALLAKAVEMRVALRKAVNVWDAYRIDSTDDIRELKAECHRLAVEPERPE